MNEQEIKQMANNVAMNVVSGLTFDENFGNITCGQVRAIADKVFNEVGASLSHRFSKNASAPAIHPVVEEAVPEKEETTTEQ